MEKNGDRIEGLIVQCQAGSQEAREALILEIQDWVHYHCVKTLRNEDDALDATQDILLAVIRGLDGLERPSSFYPWLHRIIARTCAKNYAKEHRELLLEDSGGALEAFESLDDQMVPEKIIDNEETRRMIMELVDALPPAQRLCVLMYYYDELSVGDIAAAMETPENTVKSRLSYARKAIKEGVDRYLSQGIKLYAFSPLPYLQYFLQKEAENNGLSPAAVARLQQAILTAGAGAAGAVAAGGTFTGAGAAVGAGAVHKGLLALAGLVLAGSVGGAALLHHAAPSPAELAEPEMPSVSAEIVPPPAKDIFLPSSEGTALPPVEEPIIYDFQEPPAMPVHQDPPATAALEPPEEYLDPSLLSEAGSIAELVPAVMPEPEPIPESEPVLELEPTPEPGPVAEPEPMPESESEPEPEPEPERKPEKTKRPQGGSSSSNRPNPAPSRPSEPDPAPSEPEEPDPGPSQPEEPDPVPPASSVHYAIDPFFGDYLGDTEEGIPEFHVTVWPDQEQPLFPFLPGRYYGYLEISDPARVENVNGYIYRKSPGTCEVRYYLSLDPEGPFELAALAHVEVIPEEPLTPEYDWGGYQRTGADGVFLFKRSFLVNETESAAPLKQGKFFYTAESSDPSVVTVNEGNELCAAAPGTAEVRYYMRWAESDPWSLAAVVQATVLDAPALPPETPGRQELRVGYGYSADFTGVWQGTLPETLEVTSSKPSVVYTSPQGRFTTLTPGEAVLTAFDPGSPDRQYELTIRVEDAFQWTYALNMENMALFVGEIQENYLEYNIDSGFFGRAYWSSADPYVAEISYTKGDHRCKIVGISPGTTEITARIVFDVPTADGFKSMEDTVSFQVQVNEAPADDRPVIRKELEKFGHCSGYGYYGGLRAKWYNWGIDLPEELTYSSSNPEVAYVDQWGNFSTLSAGSAVLTANSADCRYELAITVEDRFDWLLYVDDTVEVNVGCSVSTSYDSFQSSMAMLRGVDWTSSDPSVFTVSPGLTLTACSLQGCQPGSAVLTGKATFLVVTTVGGRTMHACVSIPVVVE